MQALNRLAFGPRPGDVDQVIAMGVDRWIDLQLHPEKIPDDAMDARLAPFRTLRMSSKEIVEEFPDNQMIKQVMDGKKPMPSDPARRAVFEVQIARLEEKKEKKEEAAALPLAAASAPASSPASASPTAPAGPAAGDSAKSEAELAAAIAADAIAAAGDGKSMPSKGMNSPGMSTMNSTDGASGGEMSMAPPAECEADVGGGCPGPPPRRTSLRGF